MKHQKVILNESEAKTMKNNHESRITRLEISSENINLSLNRIETKLDKVDDRLWHLVFFMFGGFATTLGVMAKGFHWL